MPQILTFLSADDVMMSLESEEMSRDKTGSFKLGRVSLGQAKNTDGYTSPCARKARGKTLEYLGKIS
jgi:hypothetical protein